MPSIAIPSTTLTLTACLVLAAPPAMAWQLPDQAFATGGPTPRFWTKAGGMRQRGRHSIQVYRLIDAHGVDLGLVRHAVAWPAPEVGRFCVRVPEPGPVPDSMVRMAVQDALQQ